MPNPTASARSRSYGLDLDNAIRRCPRRLTLRVLCRTAWLLPRAQAASQLSLITLTLALTLDTCQFVLLVRLSASWRVHVLFTNPSLAPHGGKLEQNQKHSGPTPARLVTYYLACSSRICPSACNNNNSNSNKRAMTLEAARPAHHDHDHKTLPTSLPDEINAATRTLHTALNRLITSRLPLGLPPHAYDASLYATGLLHFAHIYLTFESAWADLVHADHDTPTSPLLSYLLVNPYDARDAFTHTPRTPAPSPSLAAFLRTLRPHGLPRSARLKADLGFLLGLSPTDLEVRLATYPGDAVAAFCAHIRRAVGEKPWVLVAYAWCFYMAVFSGGRWIRAQLLATDAAFWPETAGAADDDTFKAQLQKHGLSFWHFTGLHDGADIKEAFKQHLAEADASALFSPDERVDIIEEAKSIFRLCATLVDELDDLCAGAPVDMPSVLDKGGDSSTNADADVDADADDTNIILITRDTRPRKSPAAFLGLHAAGWLAMGCVACVAFLNSSIFFSFQHTSNGMLGDW